MDGLSYLSYSRAMTTHSDDAGSVNRAIGGRVAWYMKYGGGMRKTQAELGHLLGLDQSAASKKLNGDRPFHVHELYAIARWLDQPIESIVPSMDQLTTPPIPTPRTRTKRPRSAVAAGAVNGRVSRGITGKSLSSAVTRSYAQPVSAVA